MRKQEKARWRRKMRTRGKMRGSSERPRLSVFRSNMHMYAQLIDDASGKTLAAVSTISPKLGEEIKGRRGKIEKARIAGGLIAEAAKLRGITKAVFDRGWYRYHGRVRALAEAAREAGLKF